MPITPLRRQGVVALLLALIVLAGALASCALPDRDAAPESAAGAAGAVHADLPPRDPEVLLPDPEPALPVTLVDDRGREVTVTKVDRVIALDRSGALSRMVWALGMGDRLVGRDIASDFPGVAGLPELTPGGHAVNPESVMALEPDLILTDGTIGPVAAIRGFREAGIPVVHVSDRRLPSTVGDLADEVAAALGLGDAGAAREAITAGIDAAAEAARARADGRRMLLLYVRGTSTALIAGRDTGAGELIEMLGGVDAAGDSGIDGGFVPLTPEALAAAAPDTVIVMTGGLESVGGVAGLVDLPGMAQTPAGANESVLDVPDSQLLSFGPQTAQVIGAMAEALYGSGSGA